ncbi:MAG: YceH family protein [Actinomycetota bacterium]
MELTSEEGRVLGCLVEKQLTTPQQYPLTENALMAACNQTTNRDPVVAYDVSSIRIAARSLREKGLLRMVHRTGERSDKHQHLLDRSFTLSAGQMAVLAVLLLRGPQTVAELRTRSERMHPFDTVAQVQEALDAMTERDQPLVARLERQPGRKELRYGQLLVDFEHAQIRQPSEQWPASDQSAPAEGLTLLGLAAEVELLRSEVAGLRTLVDGLREGPERD